MGLRWTCLAIVCVLTAFGATIRAADENTPRSTATTGADAAASRLFARDNLVAWCIVPFDSKKRGPVERVAMLRRLGFRRYAYDWRDEHLPSFDTEVAELQKSGIELTAVWFPALDASGKKLLQVLKDRGVKTQLWVTGGGEPATTPELQRQRIVAEAARIRPIAEAASSQGCSVALYNHGGWFGEPENQLAIIGELKLSNVKIVYNLHHGHAHLARFAELLKKMQPHLVALNLNGMVPGGDAQGRKILPLGAGDLDLELLKTIRDSGYSGPIGILGHTDDDAEDRLRDNLDGLDWLLPQLRGAKAGTKPKYRTPIPETPAPKPPAASGPPPAAALGPGKFGLALDARVARAQVAGQAEYRQPPMTVECWARLFDPQPFNILLANEPKSSGTHWELFTFAGTGRLTAYLPGMTPDHVHSEAVITDGHWHYLAMIYEPRRVRLFVDAKQVADAPIASKNAATKAGGLAIGSLVTHEIGCGGLIDDVRISQGAHDITAVPVEPLKADQNTLGLWRFDSRQEQEIKDEGRLNQPAHLVSAERRAAGIAPRPPPGVHNLPVDPNIEAKLIDRSEDDVLMAIKTDPQGRVFVGGREGVFVFEPGPGGDFLAKRELYRFPKDAIIIGLEWRGDDLFVLTSSALYVLPRGRVEHKGPKPQRLLWGLPLDLHVSFHCLAWGPEGDVYLTHGDPLLAYGDWSRPDHWGHWTLHLEPGDRRVPYTGSGSVLRLKLSRTETQPDNAAGAALSNVSWRVDGLEVVATGLRGPVGLAFDTKWNLFTNDNDHESMADRYAPAKLLHVTPHIDFGWPRGWMASKSPDRADLIEPMSAELGRGVPCDLVYYDEPELSEALRGCLLMARWDRRAVTAYQPIPRGASFKTEELTVVEGRNDARPVGLAVGPGGRLFVTSLFLAGNVASPYCHSDLAVLEPAAIRSAELVSPYDPVRAPAERLWAELDGPSWLRRGWAHQEILRRGGPLLDEAVTRLGRIISQPAAENNAHLATHLIWLAASSRSPQATSLLQDIAKMKNDKPSRWQALRALTELARPSGTEAPLMSDWDGPPTIEAQSIRPLFVAALSDADSRVQLAGLGFFLETNVDVPIAAVAAVGATDDTYLRQTAARLLAQRARPDELASLLKSHETTKRLIGTLAAGLRLTVPPRHAQPPASLPLSLPAEGAFFKLKLPLADSVEPVSLIATGPNGSFTMAKYWSSIARSAEQENLFELLTEQLDDADRLARLQAAYFLSLLRDPRTEEQIERTRTDVLVGDLAPAPRAVVERVWMIGPFSDVVPPGKQPHLPEQGQIDLASNYGGLVWTEMSAHKTVLRLPQAPEPASAYGYFRVESASRQNSLLRDHVRNVSAVWQNGRQLASLTLAAPTDGPAWLLDLQPGGNEVLVRFNLAAAPQTARLELQAEMSVAIRLPEKLDSNLLAERLRAAGQSGGQDVPREFFDVDWSQPAKTGNVDQGRRLFGTLGCVKCHAIVADQKGGGAPSLTDARRRFTTLHLVESILLPSKQIADAFRGTTLVTAAGKVESGLIVSEDATAVELLLQDATRRLIQKSDIEERQPSEISPMPAGLVKSVVELQDLLAYLLSENPTPP
jgi:putative heme-binding domain-containing protein